MQVTRVPHRGASEVYAAGASLAGRDEIAAMAAEVMEQDPGQAAIAQASLADATCYLTDGRADVATSHDPKPFFLTLQANFDLRFGIRVADCPNEVLSIA